MINGAIMKEATKVVETIQGISFLNLNFKKKCNLQEITKVLFASFTYKI